MAFRCEECNLLCGVEQGATEFIGAELFPDHKGKVGICAEVRMTLYSTCCKAEVAEASIELENLEIDMAHPHNGRLLGPPEYTLTLTAQNSNYFVEKNGKRPKHFYGTMILASITCSCGLVRSVTTFVDEQSSNFDLLA